MRNISAKVVNKLRTQILYSNFFFFRKSCLYEIMRKNVGEPDMPRMTFWPMRITHWSHKAINTQFWNM